MCLLKSHRERGHKASKVLELQKRSWVWLIISESNMTTDEPEIKTLLLLIENPSAMVLVMIMSYKITLYPV